MSPSFIRHHFTDAELPTLLTVGDPFIALEQVRGRPDDSVLEQMEINIGCKGAMQRALNIAGWFRDLQTAKGVVQVARAALAAAQENLQTVRRELDAIARVHVPLLVLNAVAMLVALFTEIGLTWSVLPAFLNVSPASLLGYAMGGLTLVLTMALEQLLDPVIGQVENLLRAEKGTRMRKVGIAMAGLLTTVALGMNAVVLIKLGLAREEAAKLLQMLLDMTSATTVPEVDPQVSVGLVIWVGVVTVLDSALVMRPLLAGLRHGVRRSLLGRCVVRQEKEVARLISDLTAAENKEANLQEWYAYAEQRAQNLSEAMESRDRAMLAEIRGRQEPPVKLELGAVVDEVLRPGGLSLGRPHNGATTLVN